ncbi:MAG TPA: isoaspartyl peptidase/L-asparaginase, partial [Acidobacteriaceae bacterium]
MTDCSTWNNPWRQEITEVNFDEAVVVGVCGKRFSLVMTATAFAQDDKPVEPRKWAVVVHGGAGVIERDSMSPEAEKEYRQGIKKAIEAAAAVLDKGGR